MGDIYYAWDTLHQVPTAIKEMVARLDGTPYTTAQLRQQFEQEATVLARLQHPHLVRVTDFFEVHDRLYLVMDFIAGENLADRIEQHGKLPEAEAIPWACQVLDALEHCHNQGVVHRDVTPQNVIIHADGRAVLVDFGLAKLWPPSAPGRSTALHAVGTPEYAPPEQYDSNSDHTDPRSDIYSLGATLYHALTGQPPPTAMQRLSEPQALKPVREIAPEISERASQAVMRALDLQPIARFQSPRRMAAALLSSTQESIDHAADRISLGSAVSSQEGTQAPELSYTSQGIVIATPENLSALLSRPSLPRRIWWQRTQMELCLIPGGEFEIGISEDALQAWYEEADQELRRHIHHVVPQHRVYLDAFYMGRYPVTQAQYALFVHETGHRVPFDEWNKHDSWERRNSLPPEGKEQHPVVLVSWDDAVAYSQWAGLRLPTELEWEKAASWDADLQQQYTYPWGDRWESERCNSAECNVRSTTPVETYSPRGDSPNGCADMAGNVREWTASLYRGQAVNGQRSLDDLDIHVLRGSAFVHRASYARCVYRSMDLAIVWGKDIGFRVAASPRFPSSA